MMKSSFAAILLIAAAARLAAAQPSDPTPPVDTGNGTPTGPVTTGGPPEPPPTPPPPVAVAASSDSHRPDGFSVGIGMGYALPTNLQQPNLTSVRIRLASGLIIEPIVNIGGTLNSADDGNGNTMSDKSTNVSVAARLRIPHQLRDRVDLVFIGEAGVGVAITDPEGDSNNTTTTELAVGWGLGLDFWITHHWCVSLVGTNPLVSWQHQAKQAPDGTGGTITSTTTATSFGAIWDPRVELMGHLFF